MTDETVSSTLSLNELLSLYFCCVQGDAGLPGLPGPKGDPGSAVTTQSWTVLFDHRCLLITVNISRNKM